MTQHDLKSPTGAKKARKRVGRGNGSGHGNYSGRGLKGQNSRSGGGVRPGFEGGQQPLYLRLHKQPGFTNIFRKRFSVVNLHQLEHFPSNAEVTPELLFQSRIVRDSKKHVKILGRGEIGRPLNVHAHGFSDSAKNKIENAGGTVTEIT